MKKYISPIKGNIDVVIDFQEEKFDSQVEKWQTVIINGDPEGLKSLAQLLVKMADFDQEIMIDLPVGAKEHFHLRTDIDLSKSSVELIIGRLDAKGTGEFYRKFKPRKRD